MERAIESLIALDQELVSYLETKENDIVKIREGIKDKIKKMWETAEEEIKNFKETTIEEYEKRTGEEIMNIKSEIEAKVKKAEVRYDEIKEALVSDSFNYIINSSKGE